jgi:hypothetical protein
MFRNSIAILNETSYNFIKEQYVPSFYEKFLHNIRVLMNSKSKSFTFLFTFLAFLLGLIIGLVVLGWWLWPVGWTGGSFNTLSPADQQDYLRSAIESYAYNPDDTIAQRRYAALGDQKEKILSAILGQPGNLKKGDIEKFTIAINVSSMPITTSEVYVTPAPVTLPAKSVISTILSIVLRRPSSTNICLPVGMLIVLVIVIFLVLFSRRKKRPSKNDSLSIEPMQPEDAMVFAEISGHGQSGEANVAGEKAHSNVEVDTNIPVETELPDWLREASPENQPASFETNSEEPPVELSDSDIKEITTSKFSTLESRSPTSLDPGEFNQASISSGAFVPDLAEASDKPDEQIAHSKQSNLQPDLITKPPSQETREETFAKFSREIERMPGIDPEDARKLRSLGITAPLLLLKKGASPQGRQSIASALNIPEMQVLKWVNSIDLLRIKGLTIEDAQMLKVAGVDIMVELATRDPESLLGNLDASSKMTNSSYQIPSLVQVQDWISQARELPRIVSYS